MSDLTRAVITWAVTLRACSGCRTAYAFCPGCGEPGRFALRPHKTTGVISERCSNCFAIATATIVGLVDPPSQPAVDPDGLNQIQNLANHLERCWQSTREGM